MMVTARRWLIWLAAIALICLGLALGRNYELDSAAASIKAGDGAGAVRKLKPLAALGDRNAQMLLGYGHAYGWPGFIRNDDDAMHWFSRKGLFGTRQPGSSGNQGAAEALSVAKAYATGAEGVGLDPQESKKWLQLAARAGSEEAAATLAKSP